MNANETQKTFNNYPTAIWTLKLTIEEGFRYSYMADLKACVAAGLVIFDDNGRGAARLTDKGRQAVNVVCR